MKEAAMFFAFMSFLGACAYYSDTKACIFNFACAFFGIICAIFFKLCENKK